MRDPGKAFDDDDDDRPEPSGGEMEGLPRLDIFFDLYVSSLTEIF